MTIFFFCLFLFMSHIFFSYSQLFVKRSHLLRLIYRLFFYYGTFFPYFQSLYHFFFHSQLNITVGLYSTWPISQRFYLLVLFNICRLHCIRDHIEITCLVISEQIVLKLPFRIKLSFMRMDGCFREAYGEKQYEKRDKRAEKMIFSRGEAQG